MDGEGPHRSLQISRIVSLKRRTGLLPDSSRPLAKLSRCRSPVHKKAMSTDVDLTTILAVYPDIERPTAITALGGAGGFSGARFWRVETPRGPFCLRCWPAEYPKVGDLQFIHAVLRHVAENGFDLAAVPLENSAGATFVRHAGHLWELSRWMPGQPEASPPPAKKRVTAALECLAQFHRATKHFRWTNTAPHREACSAVGPSPGIRNRQRILRQWMAGRAGQLRKAVGPGLHWPEMAHRTNRLLELLPQWGPAVADILGQHESCEVPLQPCLRDVWSDHVLFQGDVVTGLIDFGSMGVDNVACDLARLLGSLARDSSDLWQAGIGAYTNVRRLSQQELGLVRAFDLSGTLLGMFNWAAWVFLENRAFEEPQAVLQRMDALMQRFESDRPPPPLARKVLL